MHPAIARALRWPALCGLALALFVAAGSIATAWAAPTFPALTGRVVDDANILSPATRDELTSLLASHEQQKGQQIVVVTLPSLQGQTIEDYGYQLGRAWGIGQKGKNNGALLIVAPKEHKVRIEVGYGLEGQLTDAQSELIIANLITPKFRAGDYDGGVLDGTKTLLKVLGGDLSALPQSMPHRQHGNGPGFGTVIVIILFWLVFGRFLWPLFFLGGLGGGFGRGGGFGGGFGGGGFGSSGGGFSGGGGSFGGGGASGSW